MASNYELWMDILDFSCIPGFPHKYAIQDNGKALFPLFQQYKYHATTHVKSFMQFFWASNIVHKDIKMRLFLLSLHLEDNLSVRNWYEGFPCKSFSSLTQFIDAFGVDWDYGIEEYEKKAMIDHIWIETFGNDQEHEEVNEDAPFEFKDPDNPIATEMKIGFAPLDF